MTSKCFTSQGGLSLKLANVLVWLHTLGDRTLNLESVCTPVRGKTAQSINTSYSQAEIAKCICIRTEQLQTHIHTLYTVMA